MQIIISYSFIHKQILSLKDSITLHHLIEILPALKIKNISKLSFKRFTIKCMIN